MEYGTLLQHVVARNMAELMTDRGWRQADLAARMQRLGFDWTINRVAQTVTLRRPTTLLEVAALCGLFGVGLDRLLAGGDDEPIQLPADTAAGQATVSLGAVRAQLVDGGDTVAAELTDDAELPDYLLPDVARKLGVPVEVAGEVARHLWHSDRLSAVRDELTGDMTGLTKRGAQSKRGHVMRSMLASMRHELATAPKKVGAPTKSRRNTQ